MAGDVISAAESSQPYSLAHIQQRTCCRLHICDSSLLLGHCKAFPIAVRVMHLLVVLVGLVVELQVQLALVALTWKAGLQGQSKGDSAADAYLHDILKQM